MMGNKELKELQEAFGKVAVSPDIDHGLTPIAMHLEQQCPKTARHLYRVADLVEDLELKNSQQKRRIGKLTRQLEAHESNNAKVLFGMMSERDQFVEVRTHGQRFLYSYMKSKRDPVYMEKTASLCKLVLSSSEYISVRAMMQTDELTYLTDFSKLFNHARSFADISRSLDCICTDLPTYATLVRNIEKLRGVISLKEVDAVIEKLPKCSRDPDHPLYEYSLDLEDWSTSNTNSKFYFHPDHLFEALMKICEIVLYEFHGHYTHTAYPMTVRGLPTEFSNIEEEQLQTLMYIQGLHNSLKED